MLQEARGQRDLRVHKVTLGQQEQPAPPGLQETSALQGQLVLQEQGFKDPPVKLAPQGPWVQRDQQVNLDQLEMSGPQGHPVASDQRGQQELASKDLPATQAPPDLRGQQESLARRARQAPPATWGLLVIQAPQAQPDLRLFPSPFSSTRSRSHLQTKRLPKRGLPETWPASREET